MKDIITLTGDSVRYFLFDRVTYRVSKNAITKLYPGADFTEAQTYDASELEQELEAILQQHIENGHVSNTSRLVFNYTLPEHALYSETGNYYVGQFENMVIVFDATTDEILYTTDLGYDFKFPLILAASPDGKILAIKGFKKIRFVNTQTWTIIKQLAVSDTVSRLTFSPCGKNLLLNSEFWFSWIWNLEKPKPETVYKFANNSGLSFLSFFIRENIVCAYDLKVNVSRLFDLADGMKELPQHIPYRLDYPVFFGNYVFAISGLGQNQKAVVIDINTFETVSESDFGKFNIQASVPIRVKGEKSVVFSKYNEDPKTYKTTTTDCMKYDLETNTLTVYKTFKGRFMVIGFIAANKVLAMHDYQFVKIDF